MAGAAPCSRTTPSRSDATVDGLRLVYPPAESRQPGVRGPGSLDSPAGVRGQRPCLSSPSSSSASIRVQLARRSHRGRRLGLRFLFVSFACFAVPSVLAVPRIHCEPSEYDFGIRDASGHVEHAFVLKNLGTDPLKIGKVRACCGASARLEGADNSIIPAGGSATVTIKLSLNNRKGDIRKITWVSSDDPATPLLGLTLIGKVNPAYELSANYINFGSHTDASGIEPKTVTLTWPQEYPPKWLDLKVSSPDFKARLLSRTTTSVTVEVTPAENLLPGKAKARITLTTGNPDYPELDALAMAEIYGPVTVTPRQIVLENGTTSPADSARPRYLSVQGSAGQTFKITAIDLPDGIAATTRAVAGGSWRIALDLKDFIPAEDQPSAIVIHTDASDALLAIPITTTNNQAPSTKH